MSREVEDYDDFQVLRFGCPGSGSLAPPFGASVARSRFFDNERCSRAVGCLFHRKFISNYFTLKIRLEGLTHRRPNILVAEGARPFQRTLSHHWRHYGRATATPSGPIRRIPKAGRRSVLCSYVLRIYFTNFLMVELQTNVQSRQRLESQQQENKAVQRVRNNSTCRKDRG